MRPAGESPIRALLRDQGTRSREAVREVRPARALLSVYGLVVASGVILLAGFAPLLIQRIIAMTVVEKEDIGPSLTAAIVTLLAQGGLIYVVSAVLAYATAEVFVPRRSLRLHGPRSIVWASLHRLGNAISITLVLTIAGAAVGLTLFGTRIESGADSPEELAAMQLGATLAILTLALYYESVRAVVALLIGLPGSWRWLAALIYPCIAAVLVHLWLPFDPTADSILHQWSPDAADGVAADGGDGDESVLPAALILFAVLWFVHFLESGTARRLLRALRGGSP